MYIKLSYQKGAKFIHHLLFIMFVFLFFFRFPVSIYSRLVAKRQKLSALIQVEGIMLISSSLT